MKIRLAACAAILAPVLFLAGCETPESDARIARIREKEKYYYTLSPYYQRAIEDGGIEVGYTDDMTYMALGKPNKIVTSADGEKVMWVYYKYFATPAAARLIMNSTNARSNTHRTAANTPSHGGQGAGTPVGFGSTQGPLTQSMELPDVTSDTLYVFFRENKVVEIQLESTSPTE